MSDLILPIKGEYFHQIRLGQKLAEYRTFNAYWCQRLEGRNYDRLIFTLGYPKNGGVEGKTRLTMPYRGYDMQIIEHKHFGTEPVEVYALRLTPPGFRETPKA